MPGVTKTIYIPLMPKKQANQNKRQRVINEVSGYSINPLTVYFKVEDSLKKRQIKRKALSCQVEDTFSSSATEPDTVAKPMVPSIEIPTASVSSIPSKPHTPELSRRSSKAPPWKKRVAFGDSASVSESLPSVKSTCNVPRSNASSSREGKKKEKLNMVSTMTILAKSSPSPTKSIDHQTLFPKRSPSSFNDNRVYWREESALYAICFRQDSRDRYDPASELHSDYYSVKRMRKPKVSRSLDFPLLKSRKTLPVYENPQNNKETNQNEMEYFNRKSKSYSGSPVLKIRPLGPSTEQKQARDFSTVLIGSPVVIHRKHELDMDSRSDSLTDIVRKQLEQRHLGYSSPTIVGRVY